MLPSAPIDHVFYARTHIRMKRGSKLEQLAAACAFLVSDDAPFITGQTININGGRYLAS
jgi:NAD(P)-dependent dehydrogenase (short-subunit alcohol dehydrogenase family)